ncbi:MAG: GxxExxY protein [Treponema sp.]|nr:GxxExxY protein [Treponema sp.]MDY3722517.1 GxxExxY protein [Treponema sp.]
MIDEDITEIIIGAAYKVANTLGAGFLEKVYENALAIELKKSGLSVKQQYSLPVYYEDELVGNYFADLLVEDSVIVELKAVRELVPEFSAKVINYLKAARINTGLLINFGKPKIEIKRLYNNK